MRRADPCLSLTKEEKHKLLTAAHRFRRTYLDLRECQVHMAGVSAGLYGAARVRVVDACCLAKNRKPLISLLASS